MKKKCFFKIIVTAIFMSVILPLVATDVFATQWVFTVNTPTFCTARLEAYKKDSSQPVLIVDGSNMGNDLNNKWYKVRIILNGAHPKDYIAPPGDASFVEIDVWTCFSDPSVSWK
jgi:hypothetical protein